MHADLALYNQRVKDVQRDVHLPIDGVPASFTHNVPKARVKEVELDVDVRALNWLTVGMAGAYTHGVYTDPTVTVYGESLTFSTFPDTPDWSGSVYAKADLPVASTTGEMSVRADVWAFWNKIKIQNNFLLSASSARRSRRP